MDIVNNFKEQLLTDKNRPSNVTIKNYLSDVRKFINWYEKNYTQSFNPTDLTPNILTAFQHALYKNTDGSLPAARSAKRYISSLRKFCRFLSDSGAMVKNPFDISATPKAIEDPWQLKAFKNFLFNHNASTLTIKNYIIDIQQFLSWLEKVTENEDIQANRLLSVDIVAIQSYRDRLLSEKKFSPTSINRKLSSLRRYMNWLQEEGLIPHKTVPEPKKEEPAKVEKNTNPVPIPLSALQKLHIEPKNEKKSYSHFAPIRLFQKTKKIINLSFDLLFFNPITNVWESLQYAVWKQSGKKIFIPVKTILETFPNDVPVVPKESEVKKSSIIMNATAKAVTTIQNVVHAKAQDKHYTVRNISKSFYAPLRLSLNHINWRQRLLYHLRYTRPAWYKTYHSYPIAHHIHFAILIFATVVAGFASYQAFVENPRSSIPALAAVPPPPPRTLSFQGRLTDKTNTPITAKTNLRFAIYNSIHASGSALLWQEIQDIAPNQDGYFSAILGKKTTLTQDLFTNNPNLYVGVTVGQNEELKPRQQFPTAGYATNAQALEGLKPITQNPNEGQNVILALDSSGDLTIGGTSSPTFQATGGQFTLAGQTLLLTTTPGSNGNVQISPDGSGIIDLSKPIQNTSNYSNKGGIPGAVAVEDIMAILATSSSQSALTINQNGSSDIISGFSNGIARFRLDSTGRAMFSGSLAVNGNTITTTATSFGIVNANVTNLSIGNSATSISLGASSGITTINNSLKVSGTTELVGPVNVSSLLTANGGITLPSGQKFTLSDFTPGSIPFINGSHELAQDYANFSWTQTSKSLNIIGSLCLRNNSGACPGATPGTIYASNATVQAADLAENYVSSQPLESGDVVMPEGEGNNLAITKTTDAYQSKVIGIVSTQPGFTLNSDAKTDNNYPYLYPLALQGRVPVKVSTINGQIKAGDPLTTSSIPGVAMKATESGQIIAKALEATSTTDATSIYKIMAFVNISYYAPRVSLTLAEETPSASLPGMINKQNTITESIIEKITSDTIAAREISTQTLKVATENIQINGEPLKDYISRIVKETIQPYLANLLGEHEQTKLVTSSKIKDALDKAASESAQPTIATSSATFAEPTASPAASLATNVLGLDATASAFASSSAVVASPSASPIPSIVPSASPSAFFEDSKENNSFSQFKDQSPMTNYMPSASLSAELTTIRGDIGYFSQGLIALGPSSLTDVAVSNEVILGNNLQISANTLNTLGSDLNIQPLRQGNLLFMGGLVAIDTQGNLQVNGNAMFTKDVTINGQLHANIIVPVPNQDLVFSIKDDHALTVKNATNSGVVHINQSGDVIASGEGRFSNLASRGLKIVRGAQADTSFNETISDGAAGKGIITARHTERTIYTPFVTRDALIYVTATSNTNNTSLYVARQTEQNTSAGVKGSFTVQVSSAVNHDISFNWWIVN